MLIVEANNIAAEMDEEVSNLHKFAKDKYSMRFPELETLVVQPLDYLLTAKELRNNVRLFGFYSSHLISQFLSLSLSHTHTRVRTHKPHLLSVVLLLFKYLNLSLSPAISHFVK